VGSATAGGNLVGTNLLAGSFIELLRNKMLLYNLGARQLTGLVGNIAIPRQSGAGTAVWETEATGNTSESAQTYDQVTMSPNEVSAYTEISHKLLLQATPGIEGLIQDDIARVLAIAIDLAGFHGSGGTQPTGIAGTSGVGSVAGAGFGWDAIVEFETDVEVGNALNGSLAYVTDPTTRGLLKTRPKVSGYPEFLMDRDGRLNTFPCFSSNQITAGAMFFGDFSQVLVGEWGSLELQVNPFIKDVEGLIRIVGRQAVDIGVRHGGAFSYSSTMS
jgi:HK97 family phage major capsid protein